MKIVLTYLDDEQKIEEMINALLQEKLAACISTFPCKSTYWWNNKIESNNESVIWIKTKDDLVDEVTKKVKELHSYDVPVIDLIDAKINSEGQQWLNEVLKN